jgi:group I intron endonuclease
MKNKICGIYKITSPSNRIYIGQSIDINRRFTSYAYYDREYEYYNKRNKSSLILRSLQKYGINQHKFEIIEECRDEELNDREVFYIEKYKSNYIKFPEFNGLNLLDGGNVPPKHYGSMPQCVKNKISHKLKDRHLKNNSYNYEQNKKLISKYDKNGILIFTYKSLSELIKCEKMSITKFINLFSEFNRGVLKNGEYFQFNNPNKFKYNYKKRKLQIEYYLRKKDERLKRNAERKDDQISNIKQKREKVKRPWTNEIRSEFFKNLNTGRKHTNRKKPSNKTNIINHLKKVHKSMEKPTLQYSKDGVFLKEFASQKDAAAHCGGKYQAIYRVCVGKRKTAYGFIWKYKIKN